MQRNVGAYTAPGLAPGYVSFNTNQDETMVVISVRGNPKEGEVYGKDVQLEIPRDQFAALLVRAMSSIYRY